jgi:hypothetical protein
VGFDQPASLGGLYGQSRIGNAAGRV